MNKVPTRSCVCQRCGKEYSYHWTTNRAATKDHCQTCYTTLKKRRTKQKALAYKGGKCEKCGYDRCARALNFHHRDPNQKSFTIGVAAYRKAWRTVQVELDKCDLLCANCHMEAEAQ